MVAIPLIPICRVTQLQDESLPCLGPEELTGVSLRNQVNKSLATFLGELHVIDKVEHIRDPHCIV